MRTTTTSRAIFFSGWLAALALAGACGKRGDPLPPLRPIPAPAEALTIRQVGDVLRLEWRAPSRNQDETTEKLDLREVEIRRRVIDLAALVEEQTETLEPPEPGEEVPEPGEEVPEAASEDTVPPPAEPAPEPEPEPEPQEATEPEPLEQEPEEEPEEEEPDVPPIPVLKIPGFAPESRPLATLESTVPGELLSYEDPIDPAWIGKRVEYAVIYTNRRKRRSRRSTVVQIDPVPVLAPPGLPTAEAGDGTVQIAWPPSSTAEAFYAVFRRAEKVKDYPDRPLNPAPLSATAFEDRTAPFGIASCYVVRLVPPPELPEPEEPAEPKEPEEREEPEEPTVIVPIVPPLKNPVRIESEPSEEVCLSPVDRFPPPPPTGLVAVRTGEDVLLTWTEVDRPDVKGYRVYRSRRRRGASTLLNEELVSVPSYTDRTAEPGEGYFYSVTSVDDSPAENESEPSELSEVRAVSPR